MFATAALWGREKHVLVGLVDFGEFINLLHQSLCMIVTVLQQEHAKLLCLGSGYDAAD